MNFWRKSEIFESFVPDEASFCYTQEEVVYWVLAWGVVVAVAAFVVVAVVDAAAAFASSFGGSCGDAYRDDPSCLHSCPFGWDACPCPCCFPSACVAVVVASSSAAVAYY